jgi:hypothetical protein
MSQRELADDVVFHSPVLLLPLVGKEVVTAMLDLIGAAVGHSRQASQGSCRRRCGPEGREQHL